ncbi:nucleotidyltransferase [Sphingobium sp. HBC34]|uniref:Nucleotidyltransferase n=1 Tax=Sphingobium cyanobacteriorum TaxID=3063954 RepID=A0ABT8ZSQ5_9SPHN|nr:nucleotidyltransferase [Sphingobium sp. HBC34]MDO7837569.1 nucleotidyltransferase [Sphingobium sp. HBC34]
MPIAENQLETWAHQGSTVQSASTYEATRRVLLSPNAPYASRNFEIFLQGSYGNDTNIYADSDVDIVICLTSTYYENIEALTPPDKLRHDFDWSAASYQVSDFKREVAAWLMSNFGSRVDPSGKAIFVPGSGGRRDSDVLACAQYRHYRSYAYPYSSDYAEGICFWPPIGGRIENYPKQHSANLTSKHQATGGWVKPLVRIFKNWRNAMIREGVLPQGLAPSYFIEGMLWNVPDSLFGRNHQSCVANALAWLRAIDPSKLSCANDQHWLVRDGPSVCWRPAAFKTFVDAAEHDWAAR